MEKLIESQNLFRRGYNKEHVTYYIRRSKKFKKSNYKNSVNYSNRRWTLDTYKDFLFLKKVVNHFSENLNFSWKDLIKAEKNNKSLINIKER